MKIDINSYIGKEFTNKYNERYKVLKYQFKEKSNHCFDVQFLETKNIQLASLIQIRNQTIRDMEQRKKIKRLDTEHKLKERNRLIKKTENKVYFPLEYKDKKILSIDLATRSTGIAFSLRGKITRWKTFFMMTSIIELDSTR